LNLKITSTLFQNELKKEVKRKTNNLHQQNRRIRELLSQQADFISASAHELRTPLNIALLQIEMLQHSFDKGDKKEDVKTAFHAMEKLHALVEKLFNVQKYDFKKAELNLRKIDFAEFVNNIYKNFLPLIKEKSLSFRMINQLPKKAFIEIDELQLQQVFHNLLSNAIKFTPKKGKIILKVVEKNKKIQIWIIDNGVGVAEKNKKSIFGKFKGSNHPERGGIGLGLYICKKILDLHKGKIWVENTPGGGSSFCVELIK
jgi:signal transduction histidine kinase